MDMEPVDMDNLLQQDDDEDAGFGDDQPFDAIIDYKDENGKISPIREKHLQLHHSLLTTPSMCPCQGSRLIMYLLWLRKSRTITVLELLSLSNSSNLTLTARRCSSHWSRAKFHSKEMQSSKSTSNQWSLSSSSSSRTLMAATWPLREEWVSLKQNTSTLEWHQNSTITLSRLSLMA